MKIQGHLRDYPLQTLIEVLAHRRESGRLRIAFEPEPAILHFLQGQLVDARMSNLEGSAAINLALSLEGAPFDFDSEFQPRKSQIGIHERAMISRLLGVQLNISSDQNGRVDGTKPTIKLQSGSGKVLERILSPPPPQTGAVVTRSQPQALAENPVNRDGFQLTLLDPANKPSRPLQQKLLRAAAFLLIVAMPIASVMTIRLSQGSDDTVLPAIDDQRLAPQQMRTNQAAPSLVDFRQNEGTLPLPQKPAKATRSKESYETKTIAEPESSKVISKITNATDGSGSVPEPPSYSSAPESRPSRTTTVVLEVMIEQGRVTEARVKNRRKGFEALEASALRIVRQRRYSKDSTGTASVSIDLIVNQ